MICFSLKDPINYKKICQEIEKMLKKEVISQEKAESMVLIIKLSEITNEQKNIK